MPVFRSLPQVLTAISAEKDASKSLDIIANAALDLTYSRHAMIAIMDDELGLLVVRHGTGEEFENKALNRKLNIDSRVGEGIIASVAATGEAIRTGNVDLDPRYRKLFSTTISEIALPVRDSSRRIRAVLNVESDRIDAFGEREKNICDALSSLVGMVLERQDLYDREEALVEIGSALDNSLTEEALIDRLMHVTAEVLRFQACSVFLHDPKTDTFVLRGSSGALKSEVGRIAYGRGEGFTGWVCDTGMPILLHHPQLDPRWRGKYVEFESDQIASFLAVPIVSRKHSIGAIRVLRRKTENPFLDNSFGESDLSIMVTIAEQVASGLENIRNMERVVHSERMIAWCELSAKSSHMIGNRVFALKGDVNALYHLLAGHEPNLDELRSIQKSLATNVTRVEEILQDFRDFLTATQINRQPTDVNQLIRETADEVFPRSSKVNLQLELDNDLPKAPLDGKRLRRAISELIENSFNYMQEGRLRIATCTVSKDVHFETRGGNIPKYVQIEIEDSGPGVSEKEKATIFQPFFSNRVKGMGLGLSIVKGIVDAHGGEVFEAGVEGQGAKFVILLPLDDRP